MNFNLLKKYPSTLALLLTSSVFCQATVLVEEDFSYPDGDLAGQNGGSGFTTPWSITTTNSNDLLSNVLGEAASGNPNGAAGNNDSTAERSFIAITDDTLGINLDYSLFFDNEGSYSYDFTLFDSNGTEVLTAGIVDDNYRVIFANGQSVSQNINNTPFNDTLDFTLDLSGGSSTLEVDSAAFNTLDTNTPLTSATNFDFSTGGSIEINSALLDQNEISIDNILITSIPEPSSLMLISCSILLGISRRNRIA